MTTLAEELNELQTPLAATRQATVTTLYDMISALNADIPPEEDEKVVAVVLRLCESGRLRRLPRPDKHDLRCA